MELSVHIFKGVIGSGFILMEDNAGRHRSYLVDKFLENDDIRRMDWPVRSSDLNAIVQDWKGLGKEIATQNQRVAENRAAGGVGPTSTETDKLPDFQNEFKL